MSSKLPKYRPQTAEKRYDEGVVKSMVKTKSALKAFCEDDDLEISSDDDFGHNESNRNYKPSFLEKPDFSRHNTGQFGEKNSPDYSMSKPDYNAPEDTNLIVDKNFVS